MMILINYTICLQKKKYNERDNDIVEMENGIDHLLIRGINYDKKEAN